MIIEDIERAVVRIEEMAAVQQRAHGGPNGELLVELAYETVFGSFAGLKFSAREFPFQTVSCSCLALAEKDGSVIEEDAYGDLNHDGKDTHCSLEKQRILPGTVEHRRWMT